MLAFLDCRINFAVCKTFYTTTLIHQRILKIQLVASVDIIRFNIKFWAGTSLLPLAPVAECKVLPHVNGRDPMDDTFKHNELLNSH